MENGACQGNLHILNEVFQDMPDCDHEDNDDEFDNTVDSGWVDIRDDSDLNLFLQDTTNISEISKVMSEIDQSGELTMDGCDIVDTLAYDASKVIKILMSLIHLPPPALA